MVALVAVVLGLGVLWFWLVGHWFARLLAFPLLALAIGACIGGILEQFLQPQDKPISALIAVLVGGFLGWHLSGLPIRFWRKREVQEV